jgi:ABC-type multidrug transport system ATPase subunit
VLLAEQLGRRFGNGRGMGPISLRVDAGEVVAVVGPNGSGKTTLMRCLATRARAQTGFLSWFGNPSREDARGRIGVLFDATAHADELSARANISFFAGVKGVPMAAADAALVAADVADVSSEPVSSFSYGMRRRLLLAEALAGDPELLLLDEPTLGLDVSGQRWLGKVLRERSRQGLAACICTNDTEFVEEVATRVCFLLDGAVLRDAPLAELLESLGGRREVRISCRGSLPREPMAAVAGVEAVAAVEGGLMVVASQREGLLADLLACLGDLDQQLVDLSVREPGLADCFLQLTGRSLDG